METATILRAKHRRLAKLIHPDGTAMGYDSAKTVDLIPHPVSDLAALHRLLTRLQHRRDCCILRGEPIDPAKATGVRRLLYPDPETGVAATIRDTARQWLALDCDSLPAPDGLDRQDLTACGRAALAMMPEAFHGAAMIVQATASHTLKPGLRLRLWFWIDRPLTGAELKRWLHAAPVDASIFAAAQPTYTAAPIFIARPDPLPARLALLSGKPMVATPTAEALTPPPRPASVPLQVRAKTADRYARAALVNAIGRILGEKARHPAILKEARGLWRLVAAGVLAESDMRAVLQAAALAIGKDDPDEIDKLIAWAEQHKTGTAPRVHHG